VKLFVSTADTSGDLHGAALLGALRARVPELEAFGLGGTHLEAAGLVPRVRQADLAVAGLFELAEHVPRLLRGYLALRAALLNERPDAAVLIDSPDLNLPLARVAQRAGVPVLYYVAPQVWAWRYGRVRALRRRASRVAVIFPFEETLLRAAGVPAVFVGHPLAERLAQVQQELKRDEVARELGFDLARPVLGLLPGSRSTEVSRNLPTMLDTARLLYRALPELQIALLQPGPPGPPALRLPSYVQEIRGRTHEAMALSTVLLAAPGTVTIEAALLGTPLVVAHRLHPLSYALARRVTRVASSCMVNLIAGSGVVSERIQEQARPAALAAELARLLHSPSKLGAARRALGAAVAPLRAGGASERVADLVLEVARAPR
jgi:lipid-A-disaccharide synthase